jgi:pyruvate carboxylase subunit B
LTVYVDAHGRRYAVDVTRRDGAFFVSIDGQRRAVDVKEVGGVTSLLVTAADGTIDVEAGFSRPARSYEISVGRRPGDDRCVVHVDGVAVEVAIVPSQPSWARTNASHVAAAGPQHITAPMPGKIVKLLVKPGDRVEARQGLVVVEAMKMENELRARGSGTVAAVKATEGTTVEAGAILVILE